LAAFHRVHAREFPWRSETDPYKFALAEILLQKTRGNSAMMVYPVLAERYPDAAALAAADERALKRILRPLGLSAKRAAQLRSLGDALSRTGPAILGDPEEAERHLPGIGAYAARAIACFAFGRSVGIVDANVVRIFNRVFALPKADPRSRIYQIYADRVARRSPDAKASNYALLDVGATVCVRAPRCGACPLNKECRFARASRRANSPMRPQPVADARDPAM
jgi:A/G-specific adenine glycosylase